MLRECGKQLHLTYEIAGDIADDVYSPPRRAPPVARIDMMGPVAGGAGILGGRRGAMSADNDRALRPLDEVSELDSFQFEPQVWRSADGRHLCHLHSRQGAVALYHIDVRTRRLLLRCVLCFQKHFTAPERDRGEQAVFQKFSSTPSAAAAAAAAGGNMIVSPVASFASPRGFAAFASFDKRQTSTGPASAAGASISGLSDTCSTVAAALPWDEFAVTTGSIAAVAFCGQREDIVVFISARGTLASYELIVGDDGESTARVLCSAQILDDTSMPGPLLAVPRRDLLVVSGAGVLHLVDPRTCERLATISTAVTESRIASLALLPPPKAGGVIAVAAATCGNGPLSIVTFRPPPAANEKGTPAGSSWEAIADALTITTDVSYDMFSDQSAAVELPDVTLGDADLGALGRCAVQRVLSIVPAPECNGLMAAVLPAAVVLFNYKSKSKNVCAVIRNDFAAPFISCSWMAHSGVDAAAAIIAGVDAAHRERHEHQYNHHRPLTLVITRSGSTALFYRIFVDMETPTHPTALHFIKEWQSPAAAQYFVGEGLNAALGRPNAVLRVRLRHHPLCSSEGAPVVHLSSLEECSDEREDTDEFTAERCIAPEAVTQMRLFDVGGNPLVAAVRHNGEVSVIPLGSADDPVVLAPAQALKPDSCNAVMVTAILVLPCASGELLLVVGDETGIVRFWQGGRVVATACAHSDAVTSIFRLPANAQRADAICASLAFDGSVVLYQQRTFDALCIMHAPCHDLVGVFWDEERENCILVSASGANVWHVITGKLERCITDWPFIREYCGGRLNYLYRSPPSVATSLCEIAQLPLVHHSVFVVNVILDAVIDAILTVRAASPSAATAVSGTFDGGAVQRPADSPTAASPSGSFVPRPNDARYKIQSSPKTMSDAAVATAAAAAALGAGYPTFANMGLVLPPTLRAVLSFIFDDSECPEVAQLRDGLGLFRAPAPRVRSTTLQQRYTENGVRTAHQLVARISVLRAISVGIPALAPLASQAILYYSRHLPAAVGDAYENPSVPACMDLMAFPCGPVQFAARIAINSAIRCSSRAEVDIMHAQLESLSRGGIARSVELAAKAILVIQSVKKENRELNAAVPIGSSFNPSFSLVGSERAKAIARELEREAISAAKDGRNESFLSALAEGWLIMKEHFTNSQDLLQALFTGFCFYHPTNSTEEYKASHGAKAVTTIAAHDVLAFRNFANKISHDGIDGDLVATRIACIYVFMRLVQTHPARVLEHIDAILGYVWRAIDPHMPRKSDRERCFPAVAALFRMAVHCMPMVSFQQHQQRLAVGHRDGKVVVYDVKTTSKLTSFDTGAHAVAAVAYSNIAHEIATVSCAFDAVKVWRHEQGGLWGMLSVTYVYKLVAILKVPTCPEMLRVLQENGGVAPFEECMKSACLLWASPNCIELSSPWHDRLQIIVS